MGWIEKTIVGLLVWGVMTSGKRTAHASSGGAGAPPPSLETADAIRQGKLVLDGIIGSQLPESVKEIGLAIAWAESRLGMPVSGAGTFAGSNNWGAMVGKGTAGSIMHPDHDSHGNLHQVQFQAHLTPDDGARAFLNTWAVGPTLEAAKRNDIEGVSAAMRARGYYTGTYEGPDGTVAYCNRNGLPVPEEGSPADIAIRIKLYASMIRGSLSTVRQALGVASS